MTDESTTSRVLMLLSLLQTRRSWSGNELATRVGVSARTIRRDIDRLRGLGYRIDAERGAIGGYRLEAGTALPPLLFTDDEAVVLAVAIRAAAVDGSIRGSVDLTVSVLAKVEQIMPPTVRARVQAAQAAIVVPGPFHETELIDPEVFAVLALACRDSELVRFRYAAEAGTSVRRVEPLSLVPVGRRWYLLAWDTDRADWRTFRLDRIPEVARTHVVTARREVPGSDAAAYVLSNLARREVPLVEATIRISAPLSIVEPSIGPFTSRLSADGEDTLWRIRDERVENLFGALAWLIWPFQIVDGDALRRFATEFAQRGGGS